MLYLIEKAFIIQGFLFKNMAIIILTLIILNFQISKLLKKYC